MTGRVLIYVQHLLGTGHYVRAAALAEAMTDVGLTVTFVAGGLPVVGHDVRCARFVQLPPARATGADFKGLADAEGRDITEAWKQKRTAALLDTLEETRPDMVITELFPFGRHKMRFELEPFVERIHAMQPRPLLVSSVRDILIPSPKALRIEQSIETARAAFDAVLVHGVESISPLEASYPAAAEVRDLLVYTGYVAREGMPETQDGADEIVVAAGGGAMGQALFEAALAAHALGAGSGRVWRFLTGSNADPRWQADFVARAARQPGTIVETARPDYRGLLANAALSVSQAGYNTMMDLLATGVRAVIVPFAGGKESEQAARAEIFERARLVTVVHEKGIEAAGLARAIDATLAGPPPPKVDARLDGAEVTAEWVRARIGTPAAD